MDKPAPTKSVRRNIHRRRELVRLLHFKNKSARQIAKKLKLSVSTVLRDLKFWEGHWRNVLIDDVSSTGEELDRMAYLVDVAWKVWEASKRDATISKVIIDGSGENQKQRTQWRKTRTDSR